MNTGEFTIPQQNYRSHGSGISLWCRQLLAIFRIEFGKSLFSRRAFTCAVLALMPILLLAAAGLIVEEDGDRMYDTIEDARQIFAIVYSSLILSAVIFLGSAAIFTTLFRGEILDRSIHYYLLSPVRREILVTGKYLAGLASAFLLFGLCTLISFMLLYLPFGTAQLITDLTTGVASGQLGQYLLVTLLACMGYGSVFMATGLLFRNPLIPLVVIAIWEMIHFILPPALKIFSVIYYLKGLVPIPLDEGPLAILVAPPPIWVSVGGMLALCFVTVVITIILLQRLEVKYTEE